MPVTVKKIVSVREKEQPCCGGSFVRNELVMGSGGSSSNPPTNFELREDGSVELREDGSNELRE